jgi:nucleoside phosphorylase
VILVVAATERELESSRDAETLVCGIGPVEAALATARALAERRPDRLLHVGLAGARTLPPPTLVVGSESVYCDILDERSLIPRVERLAPDPEVVEVVRRALPEARMLPIGTSASVGGGTTCDVEAMEGFGVLRAAALAGVPAVELRAVSNLVGEADRSRWRFEDAFAVLAEAVPRVLAALA